LCRGYFWVKEEIYKISPNRKFKSSRIYFRKKDPMFEIGINSSEIELGQTLFSYCK